MMNIDEEKVALSDTLAEKYAQNQIAIEEYERLVEYITKIETGKELTIARKIIEESVVLDANERTAARPESSISNAINHYTILSSRKIPGSVIGQSNGLFVTILGESQITIGEKDLLKNETVLNVATILGSTIIRVPENVTVINEAVPVVGDVRMGRNVLIAEYPGIKKLIIRGMAILGDVTVKLRKGDR
jgi:hypothetical protein